MSLDFRIEQLEQFRVVGVMINTTIENNCCRNEVPSLWGEVIQHGKLNEIMALSNQIPVGIIGISSYNTDTSDSKKFNYYIAAATDKPVPEGMVEFMVPAATWAVFPCKRTEIAEVEIYIASEWQKEADYEMLNRGYETGEMISQAPDMEVHKPDDTSEVWVAVRKK